MDLEGLGTFKEHEGHPLIHLVRSKKSPIHVEQGVDMSGPILALLGLPFFFFPNATRIKSQQFILLIK